MRKLLTPLLRLLLPLGVLCALLIVQFEDPLFRMRIRDLAFDQLQKLHPAPYVDDIPVRVVAIDDPSLAAVGQWPWPRTVMAQVVDQLTAWGARVVVMDLILAEPDRTSPEQVKQFWPDNAALDAMLAKFPSHDQILAESMARSRVVTGVLAHNQSAPGSLPERPTRFVSQGGDARDWLKDWAGGTGFLPPLSDNAAGAGVVTVVPDYDGILRSVPLVHLLGGRVYPSLALDALRVYMGEEALSVQVRPATEAGWLRDAGISGVGLGSTAFLQPRPIAGFGSMRARKTPSATYPPSTC